MWQKAVLLATPIGWVRFLKFCLEILLLVALLDLHCATAQLLKPALLGFLGRLICNITDETWDVPYEAVRGDFHSIFAPQNCDYFLTNVKYLEKGEASRRQEGRQVTSSSQ